MKIGIIVAMDKEYAQLQQFFVNNPNIVLSKCGIGKVNAAVGAVKMILDHQPDLIVSSGCAGGADTSLNVGDVVVSRDCIYHDAYCGDDCEYGQILGMPARFSSPTDLIDKALSLNGEGKPVVKAGTTASGEWFVDSREKMRDILAHVPDATAVDMESCAIAQVCHLHNVKFLSFRVISDVPLKDHKAEQYYDFWDRLANKSFHITRDFIEAIIK